MVVEVYNLRCDECQRYFDREDRMIAESSCRETLVAQARQEGWLVYHGKWPSEDLHYCPQCREVCSG